jgi:LEA14-like dessication related protein
MKHLLQRLLILFFMFFLSGCAELAKHAETIKPTARLTGTHLANINFEQADLVFDLAVENQNPVAINLAGLNYDLKIEDQSLMSGVTAQGLEIKPASTSTVQLPVTLKFDDLRKLPGELWQRDRFAYQLDTKIVVDLPVIGNYAIPLSKSGELPVPKLPDIKIKGVTIKNLSLAAAEVVAQVEIYNPNVFDLAFSDFNYQLDINQQNWGQGSISQRSSIPQKAKSTIDIPVKLNIMSMGQTAYQLLSSKQPLEYQLKGAMTLDTGIELLRNYRMPLNIKGKASLN